MVCRMCALSASGTIADRVGLSLRRGTRLIDRLSTGSTRQCLVPMLGEPLLVVLRTEDSDEPVGQYHVHKDPNHFLPPLDSLDKPQNVLVGKSRL